MTDDKIIKALEEWSERGMSFCNVGMNEFARRILALISRQKAEIGALLHSVQSLSGHLSSARAEAIKEFAERLKENEREHCQWCNHSNKGGRSEWCNEIINGHCRCLGFSKFESKLDNLVKEMVGADNG